MSEPAKTANTIALVAAVTAIAAAYFTYLQYSKTEELVRPYLEISLPVFVFYDEKMNLLETKKGLLNPSTMQLQNQLINHGDIPAEVIYYKFTVDKLGIIDEKSTSTNRTVYKNFFVKSHYLPVNKNLTSSLNLGVEVKMVAKYRAPNNKKEYTSTTISTCKRNITSLDNKIDVIIDYTCSLTTSSTN